MGEHCFIVIFWRWRAKVYIYLYLSLSEFHELWKSLPNLCFSPTNLSVQCGHHRTVFLFLCLRSFLHNNWKFSHQNLHWFVPASQMGYEKTDRSPRFLVLQAAQPAVAVIANNNVVEYLAMWEGGFQGHFWSILVQVWVRKNTFNASFRSSWREV